MIEVECYCGHIVTFSLVEDEGHLSAEALKEFGKRCICVGCYVRMTGQSVEVAPRFEGKKPKMLLVKNLPSKLP